jgi:hypothetical protein
MEMEQMMAWVLAEMKAELKIDWQKIKERLKAMVQSNHEKKKQMPM